MGIARLESIPMRAEPFENRFQQARERVRKPNERKANGAAGDNQDGSRLFDPWERYVVPTFPFDILPPPARQFVLEQSAIIGCDPSALAMAVLTNFSGALDHRFALKMMRNGKWYASPRLWVLLNGGPSCQKTPIFNVALRPLQEYEHRLRDAYDEQLNEHRASGGDAKSEPPKPDRHVVSDTTIEKLGELLSRQDRGLMVKRDEIAGWIGSMEKYSGSGRASAADRAFWLQSYDGGPYTVDRIGRGELRIPNLSISLIGGIQPGRLAQLHGLTSDGLLQRFIPVMMRAPTEPQDRPDNDDGYEHLTHALIFAKPQRLILSDAGLAAMNDLQHHIFQVEQAADGLADGFQSFVGKLKGIAGSLALILHMAADPEQGACHHVDQVTVENVRRLILDFILPHAHEFYRSADAATDGDRLKKIASYILTANKVRLTTSDFTRNVAELRGLSLFDASRRVSPFVSAGWLTEEAPGPTNRSWRVEPHVFKQFAERARIEDERKAALAELMRSPRRRAANPHSRGQDD